MWTTLARFRAVVDARTSPDDVLDVDTVLTLIRSECVSILAATAATTGVGTRTSRRRNDNDDYDNDDNDDDASYRYEEEPSPEQFFVPYVWQLVVEQTPDFCWKTDKITLFAVRRPHVASE